MTGRFLKAHHNKNRSENARRVSRAHGVTACERAVLEDIAKSEVRGRLVPRALARLKYRVRRRR